MTGPSAYVVDVSGEIDLLSAPILREHFRDLVWDGLPRVIVDLRNVSFMDSTGLAELVWLGQQAKAAGKRLAFVPGPPNVQKVFEVTGLARSFDWVDGNDVS